MVEIGNIKPTGPIPQQPPIEKVKRKEEQADRRNRQQQNPPAHKEPSQDESGVDEYV